MKKKPIIIDTETTGFGNEAEVIQIGVMDLEGNVLLDTLVQCLGEIPQEAIEVHGITKDMLADAPVWAEVHEQLAVLLFNAEYVIIYNNTFDTRLIKQTAQRHGLTMPKYFSRCAMREYANMYFDGEWVSLGEAAHYEHVDTTNIKAHSAVGDCEMTRQVWLALESEKEKRAKRKAKRLELRNLKMELVPSDADSGKYTDYGQGWRPEGFKTLSQLRKRDLKKYEFAGTCCNTYGDRGYLFKPLAESKEA
ncbi:TPA: exonuclease domain-containing protein [Vibrio parahaemolyticus]